MVNKFENWNNFIDPRAEDLISKGFYLEAFFLYFSTIEFMLQNAIIHQQTLANKILKRSKLKIPQIKKLENKTMGELINLFASYSLDQENISTLNNLNSMRIQFVHKILDNDLDNLNKLAKSKISEYHRLVKYLSVYNLDILNKLIKIKRRTVYK